MRNDILEEAKKQKALSRRFRQPICKNLNLMAIQEFLHDAKEAAEDVAYAISDDDVLVDIMDGNTDQAHEFMMTFSLLAGDLERFADDLEEQWVPECFDLFFAGIGGDGGGLLGYDDYECDYFGFDDLNTELSARLVAEERLLRMTKKRAAGRCRTVLAHCCSLLRA